MHAEAPWGGGEPRCSDSSLGSRFVDLETAEAGRMLTNRWQARSNHFFTCAPSGLGSWLALFDPPNSVNMILSSSWLVSGCYICSLNLRRPEGVPLSTSMPPPAVFLMRPRPEIGFASRPMSACGPPDSPVSAPPHRAPHRFCIVLAVHDIDAYAGTSNV